MGGDDIEIPKELLPLLPDKVAETSLGQKNGANKQYRYGNLHIREYDDKFLVHTDKFDPRKEPLNHLIFDAPEVLIGLVCAVIGGGKVASYIYKKNKNSLFSKQKSTITGIAASLALGYLGYAFTKKIKDQ